MSLPDLSDPRIAAILGVYFGCLALAAWLGGDNVRGKWLSPERAFVVIIILMFLIQSFGYDGPRGNVFDELDVVALASDLAGFVGFSFIALYADRLWPLFAAGLQIPALLSHLPRSFRLDDAMAVEAYNFMKSAPTAGVLLIVLVAAILRWRKSRRVESIRDWVPWRKYATYRAPQDQLSDF